MENSNEGVNSFFWWLAVVLVYAVALFFYVGLVSKPDSLSKSIMSERTSNSAFGQAMDAQSWGRAMEGGYLIGAAKKFGESVKDHKTITHEEKILETIWDNTPENMLIYSVLIEYRLNYLLSMVPVALMFIFAVFVDAIMVRKKNQFKNSFSSPFKHNIGGRIVAIPSGFLFLILTFLPMAMPMYVFTALFAVKFFGWWLWTVNLPKRI